MIKRILALLLMLLMPLTLQAQPEPETDEQKSCDNLVRQAWVASNKEDLDVIDTLTDQMISSFGRKADVLASQLSAFPRRDEFNNYRVMSDVATILFIKAETMMHKGQDAEAIKEFKYIIVQYPFAQSFDPSRGSYWSIAEKSQDSIDTMQGKSPAVAVAVRKIPRTIPVLAFPGKDLIIDWTKYGNFVNVGTPDFHYSVTDHDGLVAALGEGIYPNIADVYSDPQYRKVKNSNRYTQDHWDYVNSPDLQASFYKWATSSESWGVRLFYIGQTFEKAHMYYHAIKAYDALAVFFPSTLAWTYWQTPWYPAQAAIYKIQYIIRMHPELHLEYKGARIRILHPEDAQSYVTSTWPGTLRRLGPEEIAERGNNFQPGKMALGTPVYYSGQGQVRFVKYSSGHWQLLVNEQPFFIKGMAYMPTKVGQSPDDGTMQDWMQESDSHNGIITAPYEAWVDKYRDNKRHADEPMVGDFYLMKQMGVNTLRIYYQKDMEKDKPFLEDMYKKYGFKVALSNFLGKYAIGSGASWSEGTDYANPQQQQNMLNYVRQMVMNFKDEPYILMWILGNENNYGVASNANKNPDAYYQFVDEVAKMIKSIDPNHPVAICNGDSLFLDKFAQYDKDVDAFGANVYRGDYGFGSFWDEVQQLADKPAFITEYGAPAYGGKTISYIEAQQLQSDYHKGNWLDILYNSAGYKDGSGNSVGGMAFEWLDEWWKDYSPAIHDTKADVVGPFPGGYYFEEWFGIMGQGDGSQSPYLREPRKVYYTYKELWKSKS